MHILGFMDLDVQIADPNKSVAFAIADNLAVPLIIGTSCQDRFIESNQCKARRLKLIKNRSVAILDIFDSSECTLESPDAALPRKVQVCRCIVIPPILEMPVKLRTFESGLRFISQHEIATRKKSFCVPRD